MDYPKLNLYKECSKTCRQCVCVCEFIFAETWFSVYIYVKAATFQYIYWYKCVCESCHKFWLLLL